MLVAYTRTASRFGTDPLHRLRTLHPTPKLSLRGKGPRVRFGVGGGGPLGRAGVSVGKGGVGVGAGVGPVSVTGGSSGCGSGCVVLVLAGLALTVLAFAVAFIGSFVFGALLVGAAIVTPWVGWPTFDLNAKQAAAMWATAIVGLGISVAVAIPVGESFIPAAHELPGCDISLPKTTGLYTRSDLNRVEAEMAKYDLVRADCDQRREELVAKGHGVTHTAKGVATAMVIGAVVALAASIATRVNRGRNGGDPPPSEGNALPQRPAVAATATPPLPHRPPRFDPTRLAAQRSPETQPTRWEPGWYSDPKRVSTWRWYDGTSWTEHTR